MRLLLCCLLFPIYSIFAQVSKKLEDTIYVSSIRSTYLVFDVPVNVCDIGLIEQYMAKIEDKTVFIKAKIENSRSTNFLVQYGSNYIHGVIKYMEQPQKYFYDFTNTQTTVGLTEKEKSLRALEVKKKEDEAKKEQYLTKVRYRLTSFSRERDKYKTLGLVEHKIYIGLTNVLNDDLCTYFKIKLVNKSTVNYQIDYINFNVMQEKALDKDIHRRDVEVVLTNNISNIAPRNEEYYCVALPLIGLKSDEIVRITLREVSGSRTIKLDIPAEKILNASLY